MNRDIQNNRLAASAHIFRQFTSRTEGATAIEFGIVAIPFLMMIFGIISIGVYFLTTYALENSADRVARLIRTGEVVTSKITVDGFKQKVCDNAFGIVKCNAVLAVHVQTFTSFGGVAPINCLDGGGSLKPSTGSGGQLISAFAGAPNQIVLVTLCYESKIAGLIPFLDLGKMNNGSGLLQTSVTFRTEPA
jgi:TadE-like protein